VDPRTVFDHVLGAVVVLATLIGLPLSLIKRARDDEQAIAHERALVAARTAEGRARVVKREGIGLTVNDVPALRLTLELEVFGRAHRLETHALTDESLEAGDEIALRFDPANPQNFVFVDDASFRPIDRASLALLDRFGA